MMKYSPTNSKILLFVILVVISSNCYHGRAFVSPSQCLCGKIPRKCYKHGTVHANHPIRWKHARICMCLKKHADMLPNCGSESNRHTHAKRHTQSTYTHTRTHRDPSVGFYVQDYWLLLLHTHTNTHHTHRSHGVGSFVEASIFRMCW